MSLLPEEFLGELCQIVYTVMVKGMFLTLLLENPSSVAYVGVRVE